MNMNYIREIAEALSENHAALMVGAGFSKNAEKVSITDKKFLNWNELSDLFYETVYGKEGPGKQYNSSLRLAQEVEITVGRPKLEKIIKDAVPDLEYAPSEVYVKLMEMPWKDVFTTNYDTLLERAADKVTNRRYNVVICQEDLVNSNNAPRILKLHGSFPSYRPFIITEEDYRTYPVKFAAMVNTVQQALLENVFCMLGFSCEDPNFIKWIGWIHDNLGKSSSQKIYMVSVTHIAEAKRKLLFERNIIVIDLQELWPDKNIGDRLNSFLEELKLRVEEKRRKDNWFDLRQLHLQYDTDFVKKTEIMKKLNESYPGWIFLPWKMKNKVSYVLNELDNINEFEHISFTDQVNYMYEYVKFMDIAGRPILSQVVDQFLNVLEKKEGDELVDSFGTELEYKEQVIYLHLLRSYRELAEWEKYEACHEKIKDAYLDYDNKQFLYACDCRKQLFRFQAEKLAGMLDSWNLVNGDMYWPLVKANMYALIGEISKADAILSDVLTLVRKQLVKASGNEYLSSIEESIVSLINFIRQGNIVDETEECIHESDVSWWNENDKYCLYLNTEEKGNKSFETKDNFDLSSTYTMHMGRDNSNVFYALEYLRFLEQTGHPFRLQNVTNTKGLHSTVKLLAPYYPHWCLMQILIAQDNKHIDLMFGRVKLYELSQKEVDDIAKEYLRIFQIVMKNVKPENFFFAKSIYEQSAVVLPDIIARLCYKCSINILDEIFDSILDLCLSNVRTNFKGIRKIFKGLFEAFSLQDQENRIEKILQFPVDVDRMSDYCDPIVFISKPREKYVLDIEIYNRILFQIKQTIKEAENEKRQAAVNRLVILAQVIILNEEDLRYLCKVLEKEETLENKSILYVLDKQKYEKNKKEIFEDTLKRMKSDSNTQMFSAGGNNYRDLIGILNDIDISKINLEEALEVLTNLVKTNQSWVERNQPNASERIRQSFLIVMGLIILRESKNIDLSETEKEKVYAYFEALSELYKNSIAIDMIEACFVDDSKFYFEDFQNKIWLSNEQELGLIKDFYDVLYINDFKLQNNDMLLKCSNMLFRISIYRVISSEILHNMAALKLCYAIIKNEIVLKTEIQTLLVCLLKLQDETVIKQTDSEQEALYKLRCRIISCKIAKELYVRGIKSDIVDGWKRISENKNEFIEIRNVVFDTTGDE